MKDQLTKAEIRALQSFHLRGYLGSCGSMKLANRRKLLYGLIEKGLLTKECNLTAAGVEASAPFKGEVLL